MMLGGQGKGTHELLINERQIYSDLVKRIFDLSQTGDGRQRKKDRISTNGGRARRAGEARRP
jgi:hypothetical protein